MGYCVYMTRAGYALQAKLFAEGGDFEVTRVMVGSGILPEETDPSGLTDLIAPRAAATSTSPVRKGLEVALSIEFRSDLCEEMEEAFQITEYGVFAVGAEGEEELVLYADLSDYPDTAVPEKYGGCVRRYPVIITVGPEAGAQLDYPAGAWVTWEELAEAIAAHDGDPAAHPYLLNLCAGLDARLALLELMYNTQISGNPFTVTFESLTGLVATGVWNVTLGRLEF